VSDDSDFILTLHVVYEKPKDLPGSVFVVRQQTVLRGGIVKASANVTYFQTLSEARLYLEHLGLTNIGRYDNDDPVIVEVWI
jgi:3-deoxy-D-arabino-heptulosonate 7-phosphate (DAHP) synthase